MRINSIHLVILKFKRVKGTHVQFFITRSYSIYMFRPQRENGLPLHSCKWWVLNVHLHLQSMMQERALAGSRRLYHIEMARRQVRWSDMYVCQTTALQQSRRL